MYLLADIKFVLGLMSRHITFRMGKLQKDSNIIESQEYVPEYTETTKYYKFDYCSRVY